MPTKALANATKFRWARETRPAHAEGCFGLFLLREDPVPPLLQFGCSGRPPQVLEGNGLSVDVDKNVLARWTMEKVRVG